jgi:cation transport regulator ChaC
MAFAFPASSDSTVRTYLREREGIALCERTIHLRSGGAVAALVTIYAGPGLVQTESVDKTAAMACRAVGSAGRCIDYVRNVASRLDELGISDPAVTDLIAAVDRAEHAV